ncbi:MAG TPA: Type 1 glutamine amidotransferase-like domain-containing protein [Gaiellaceae bacterium]|nr:Type 1 glutamine amidotransferase-like domain-containing protein [Gaiellaceae bacterium]
MRLLLTSGGVTNGSIHDALLELLGKPIDECDALLVPTALYAHPLAGPRQAWRTISGQDGGSPMVGLGWNSVGVLELTALPSLDREQWVPVVQGADALLVDGGDAAYLCHWLRASGLTDLFPSLDDTVWLSVSAGSMVLTPRTGMDFVNWHSEAGDAMLGVVDFSIFPHLDVFPTNTMAAAERWAAGLGNPAYAVDDETAFKVVDGTVEVVSEGRWKLLSA